MLLAMTFSSTTVLAHTALKSSTPSNNAMLMKSPKMLKVKFGNNVRLVSLSLENVKNEEVEFDFSPSMEASKSFNYKLPKLMPSTYIVTWVIMGDDGHKMKGDFSFMVHEKKGMKEMKDKQVDHSQHSNH